MVVATRLIRPRVFKNPSLTNQRQRFEREMVVYGQDGRPAGNKNAALGWSLTEMASSPINPHL